MADINELMKQIALAAIEESKPSAVLFGEVTGTNPLEITIDQKMTLTDGFLILTNNVRDHDVYMSVEHTTATVYMNANHSHGATSTFEGKAKTTIKNKVDPTSTKVDSTAETEVDGSIETSIEQVQINLNHSHDYVGKKKFTAHYGLSKGEKVILLRIQGGQKFIVLDRLAS